ncbi:MAG: hypothetical protein NT002_12030 [candidate division Zixibacteria bacterium]|nr:hypothetical protein [candidate division Zixibacteria bacterium]
MKVISSAMSMLMLALIVSGCTLADRHRAVTEETRAQAALPEGRGDAYLFDVTIVRQGKKNSARLDVYQQGDSISFFARGYLGKGVMKGLLEKESLTVYFPTENEFYSGRLSALVNDRCADSVRFEELILALFRKIPSLVEAAPEYFYLTATKETPQEVAYRLESKSCQGGIGLKYDFTGGRFALSEISYLSDKGDFRFEARRRNVRLNIKLPADKFVIPIPSTAARIYPRQ